MKWKTPNKNNKNIFCGCVEDLAIVSLLVAGSFGKGQVGDPLLSFPSPSQARACLPFIFRDDFKPFLWYCHFADDDWNTLWLHFSDTAPKYSQEQRKPTQILLEIFSETQLWSQVVTSIILLKRFHSEPSDLGIVLESVICKPKLKRKEKTQSLFLKLNPSRKQGSSSCFSCGEDDERRHMEHPLGKGAHTEPPQSYRRKEPPCSQVWRVHWWQNAFSSTLVHPESVLPMAWTELPFHPYFTVKPAQKPI